ncbi:MAG: helix-turn-helix domain-containing protein, partial [Kiritimatiellales bacterium]
MKRSAILQAAARLFEGRRFDEVKLDEIAASVGIGKGTLYLYFKNKEDLFAQIAIDGIDEMTARILAIAAMNSPYKERLFLFAHEFTAFLTKRHGVTRMMNQVQSDPVGKTFRTHHNRMIEAIHELLQKGMDEGALRNDFKVAELRCVLVGPILLKVRRAARVGEIIELNALLIFFWAGAAAQ